MFPPGCDIIKKEWYTVYHIPTQAVEEPKGDKKGVRQLDSDVNKGRPSIMRWWVLFMLCMAYLITYMDRLNISVTAPMMSQEFGIDKVTMGAIFSIFLVAYGTFSIPGGWLGDRFGPRRVLTVIVIFWSFMTALTARCTSATQFLVVRGLFGAGEAGSFPTATRAMQLWLTREERGFAQGLTHAFARVGAAIIPPICVAIMVTWGWRAVFYIFSGIGIVWAVIWWWMYRDYPELHKAVNDAELAHIRGVDENGVTKTIPIAQRPKIPWKVLLKHKNMWGLMVAYFCYIWCTWIFFSWLPSYLVEYRGFTLVKMGIFASLPFLAGAAGNAFGGWLTDYLLVKTKNTVFARRAVAAPGMLGGAIFVIPAALTGDAYIAVACICLSMFCLECSIGPAWAVPMDVGGAYSGTVSGVMTTAGQFGGAISGVVFGYLVQYFSWVAPFMLAGVMCLIAAATWAFWINPEVSVIDKDFIIGRENQVPK